MRLEPTTFCTAIPFRCCGIRRLHMKHARDRLKASMSLDTVKPRVTIRIIGEAKHYGPD